MRPSCHCASATPCSAAYSSELTAFVCSPARKACAPERNASTGERWSGRTLPSKPIAGLKPTPSAITASRTTRSNVRITRLLSSSARVSHRAIDGGPHLLGVFPDIAGAELALPRLPILPAVGELLCGELHIERACVGIDLDDVAVAQQGDRTPDGGFRADMADAEAPRGAGKTAVGDQCDLAAHSLAGERGRGRQHFTHARPAARALVADDQHLAFPVFLARDRGKARFLAVEAARRTGKLQVGHAGDLHNRALGREVAL